MIASTIVFVFALIALPEFSHGYSEVEKGTMFNEVEGIMRNIDMLQKNGREIFEMKIYSLGHQLMENNKGKSLRQCIREQVHIALEDERDLLGKTVGSIKSTLDPIVDIIMESKKATDSDWDKVKQFLQTHDYIEYREKSLMDLQLYADELKDDLRQQIKATCKSS